MSVAFGFRAVTVLTLGALAACAESQQAWRELTANAKKTVRTIGKSCPPELPGRASGCAEPEAALGCFQKTVAEGDAHRLLSIVCHSHTAASCKHTAGDEAEAKEAIAAYGQRGWDDVLGTWSEKGGHVKVYAIDNQGDSKNVSTVTLCRIAQIPADDAGTGGGPRGWAVCDVGEMHRDAAKKKSES